MVEAKAGGVDLEAEDVLGHGHDPRTGRMAKILVDHALAYGWDENYGGFFQKGTTFGKPESKRKEWWVEMEGLNSLLLMHEKYAQQTDVYCGNGSSFSTTRPTLNFTECMK
jgi:cellobiose epimerase